MSERLDADGSLRLTLRGDLDLAVAETMSARLKELKEAGQPIRLDLSQLAFIDSSGIQALLVAVADARWIGWRFEVAPEVSPAVDRAAPRRSWGSLRSSGRKSDLIPERTQRVGKAWDRDEDNPRGIVGRIAS